MWKKVLLIVVPLLIAIQFVRLEKNSGMIEGPDYIGQRHPVPAAVRAVLARACFDCHSNQTRYPWYAEVQPLGWWLAHHIDEGKEHLNFAAFGAYSAKRQRHALDKLAKEVRDREMPLASYTWLHPEAALSAGEITLLSDWAAGVRETIAGN